MDILLVTLLHWFSFVVHLPLLVEYPVSRYGDIEIISTFTGKIIHRQPRDGL